MGKNSSELEKRIQNEKDAHDVDDVLRKSYQLKKFFFHILETPARKDLDNMFVDLYKNKNLQNIRVLDFGCGEGETSFKFIKSGAVIDGIDISEVNIQRANSISREKNVNENIKFHVMDAHNLDFEDNSFDLVFGEGILHHLDIYKAVGEINRVLKPNGRAVFMEPLGNNPLLKIFRLFTSYTRTPDERPLYKKDILKINSAFSKSSNKYFGIITTPVAMFTSLILRKFPNNFLIKIAYFFEKKINKVNFFKYFNQYVVFDLRK
tara:strand:- start:491 stop:1282 length:792 start_codon:yes stop_codon:yes gene_type:complete